jgi:hypothetical protein
MLELFQEVFMEIKLVLQHFLKFNNGKLKKISWIFCRQQFEKMMVLLKTFFAAEARITIATLLITNSKPFFRN